MSERGFSIIELAVALAVAGVLLVLGMPSLTGYIQNARLGSAAKSVYGGLQLARSEAVRRNQAVEFVLTNTAIVPGVENALVSDVQGRNWVVRTQASASAPYELIDAKSALEGAGSVSTVGVAASAALVTFNALGGTTAGVGNTIALDNPAMGLCVPAGPVRCWNVVVSPGGQVRLCNPDPTALASDTRKC